MHLGASLLHAGITNYTPVILHNFHLRNYTPHQFTTSWVRFMLVLFLKFSGCNYWAFSFWANQSSHWILQTTDVTYTTDLWHMTDGKKQLSKWFLNYSNGEWNFKELKKTDTWDNCLKVKLCTFIILHSEAQTANWRDKTNIFDGISTSSLTEKKIQKKYEYLTVGHTRSYFTEMSIVTVCTLQAPHLIWSSDQIGQ